MHQPPALQFRLLGEPTLRTDAGRPIRVSSQKGMGLLSYLAMHAGQPVSRQHFASLLWPDRAEASARQNLRQTILTLRRNLGEHDELLNVNDQTLLIEIDIQAVDALQFQSLVQNADPTIQKRCLDIAWAPFMDGFALGTETFDAWVLSERQRLQTCATRAFCSLASHLDQIGDGQNAIRAAERLVELDPTEQTRHRRLLSLELKYHGSEAALARFKSCASMLKEKFDAEVEPETRALTDAMRSEAAKPFISMTAAQATPPRQEAEAEASVSNDSVARTRTWRLLGKPMAAAILLCAAAGLALVAARQSGPAAQDSASMADADKVSADNPWQSPLASAAIKDQKGKSRGLIPVVVLPFKGHGAGDDRGSAMAEIVTDNLTNVLARIPIFRVISRQTAATYRDHPLNAAKIAAQLGVEYLIEGSALHHDGKAYINVALIDGKTQSTLWSGRYERSADDLTSLLGEVVYSLGRELQIEVSHSVVQQQSGGLTIERLVFQGWLAIDQASTQGASALDKALEHFSKALGINPEHVSARLGLAAYHTHMALQLVAADPAAHIAKAESILRAEIERNPNISPPYSLMGLIEIARNRPDEAMRYLTQAVALNPSHAPSHAQIGRLLVRAGKAKEGLDHIRYAMRLSPRDPAMPYWIAFAGYAELELENYDRAVSELTRAHALNPGQARTTLTLVAAHAMAGDLTKARRLLAELQHKRPHLSAEVLVKRYRDNPALNMSRSAKGILRALESDY